MDPISRESSPSYLPIAGLIAGIVGLILGAIALVNSSKANSAAAAAAEQAASQASRIDGIEATATSASSAATNASAAANRAVSGVESLKTSTQEGFNMVAAEFGKTNGELAKLQQSATRSGRPAGTASAAPAGASAAEPAGAGPGEYLVKAGDTGYKIATANGVSVADLQAVNPGVSWTALKVGQKLKLPKK